MNKTLKTLHVLASILPKIIFTPKLIKWWISNNWVINYIHKIHKTFLKSTKQISRFNIWHDWSKSSWFILGIVHNLTRQAKKKKKSQHLSNLEYHGGVRRKTNRKAICEMCDGGGDVCDKISDTWNHSKIYNSKHNLSVYKGIHE